MRVPGGQRHRVGAGIWAPGPNAPRAALLLISRGWLWVVRCVLRQNSPGVATGVGRWFPAPRNLQSQSRKLRPPPGGRQSAGTPISTLLLLLLFIFVSLRHQGAIRALHWRRGVGSRPLPGEAYKVPSGRPSAGTGAGGRWVGTRCRDCGGGRGERIGPTGWGGSGGPGRGTLRGQEGFQA